MVSETGNVPDPENNPKRKVPADHGRTYDARKRFYTGLLLFSVIVGLTVLIVPSLRNRLFARVTAIEEAILGTSGPVLAELGEEPLPFPEEYERPASTYINPGDAFPIDRIFTSQSDGPFSASDTAMDTAPALITPQSAKTEAAAAVIYPDEASDESDSQESDSDDGIVYTQGETDQEMYALLLDAYPKVSSMVEGNEPALQFISWGSAKISEDIYWVRLVFKADNDKEIEYIWQVEVETEQVSPLSHNARTIS